MTDTEEMVSPSHAQELGQLENMIIRILTDECVACASQITFLTGVKVEEVKEAINDLVLRKLIKPVESHGDLGPEHAAYRINYTPSKRYLRRALAEVAFFKKMGQTRQ